MSQTLDRMSTLDAEFLYAEHHNVPMHIGSVAVFEGPAARAPGPVTAISGTLYLYVVRPGRPIMRHARCASSRRCQALEVDHGRSRAVAQTAPPKLCL